MGSDQGARSGGPPTPVRQTLASDADVTTLAEYFLRELDARVAALDRANANGALDELRDIARQLKGAGGGYGFPDITHRAAALERALLSEVAETSAIGEKVEDLIRICRRACETGSGDT